jgi:phosphatidylserine/phosphatidylglycerophosphate/cardiolipin synthase-like enzyme
MKKNFVQLGWGIIGLIIILSMQSCQNFRVRKPSSFSQEYISSKTLEEIYTKTVELDYLNAEERTLTKRITPASKQSLMDETNSMALGLRQIVQDKIKLFESQLKLISLEAQNESDQLKANRPLTQWSDFNHDWRKQKERLVINNPENYLLNDGEIVRTFSMDLFGTTDYQLGIVNKAWVPNAESGKNDFRRFFEANIKCDDDFKIKKTLFSKSVPKNKEISFRINEQINNSPNVILHFNQKVSHCEITFKNPESPEKTYGVRLVSDKSHDNKVAEYKNKFQTCLMPNPSELQGVEKLFLTSKYNSMTCANEVSDIQTLEDPIDGLKVKAESLLGQDLPANFIKDLNPYAPLDFSKAPKLKMILISYLVFRHDFYGAVIARLAKWHAEHGTQVKILMSDVIANAKDRLLLHDLVESTENIKLQEYRYDSEEGGIWDHISELHRTMHVKLFVTIAENPTDNVVFIGGRNIHDGFVFMTTPDHSNFPNLIQYGKGKDENYAPWRDYEMKIRSKDLAEEIASHYMTLWQRDSESFYLRSINQNIVTSTKADPNYFDRADNTAMVRHFMSVPYKDESALENFYVDVFDSAQKTVRLSSPYFRPTKKLSEAMERAVARGVDISLITRIDLKGDTFSIILSEVNKAGINGFLNKIKVYEYTEPGVILHSKIVLVDDKLSLIGSVNLNKRSFVHDMENSMMIYSPSYNKKMNEILDVYKLQTNEVTEKQKIAFWKKVVIGLFDKEF